jgi:tetratricopeptide (TPR) repeat protein
MLGGGIDPARRDARATAKWRPPERPTTLAVVAAIGLLAVSSAAIAVFVLGGSAHPPRATTLAPLPERPPQWRFPAVSFARAFPAHMAAVESIAFAPNGGRLLSASADETAKVWDPWKARLLHVLRGHTGAVVAACVAGDGTLGVTAGDRSLRVWSLPDGKPLRTIDVDTESLVAAGVSPSGRTLVAGGTDGVARVWDSDGSQVATLRHGGARVSSIAFSPDGSRLATAGDDATVKVWGVADWSLRQTLTGHGGPINAIAVAPDGDTIASASDDRTVRLWQLERGSPLGTLSLHADAVWSVAFSPDGRTLVSGGGDAVLGVWRLPEGTLKQRVDSNAWARGTRAVAFAPDGSSFFTAHGDGELAIWQVARSGAHLPLPGVRLAPTPTTGVPADECQRLMDEAAVAELSGKTAGPQQRAPARADTGNPSRAEDYCLRGWALLERKDEAGARLAVDAARRMDPGLAAAALLSARLDVQRGDLEEARDTLVDLLSRPHERHAAASALAALADTYERMGDVDADGEARRKAVELDPQAAIFLAGHAAFLTRKGDLDAAVAVAKQAQQTPGTPNVASVVLASAYCRKGERLLWDRGDPEGALRAFEEAASADTRSACSAYGRGAYYQRAAALQPGSKSAQSQAKSWYAKALALDPSDLLAGRALSNLGAFDPAD